VIAATGNTVALAAKAATTTIPIVFVVGGDPVEIGLVASLNRPGWNITGVTTLEGEMAAKRLQLLHELMLNVALFGVLADPADPTTQSFITDLQAAARTLGRQLVVANARADSDLETVLTTLSQQRVGAVLVGISTFFNRRMEQLTALAARHALPAICHGRRPDELWQQPRLFVPPSWHLYRAHSQRRETSRSAGAAGTPNEEDPFSWDYRRD
jgi:putative ABC transport system substrate-binding protein